MKGNEYREGKLQKVPSLGVKRSEIIEFYEIAIVITVYLLYYGLASLFN